MTVGRFYYREYLVLSHRVISVFFMTTISLQSSAPVFSSPNYLAPEIAPESTWEHPAATDVGSAAERPSTALVRALTAEEESRVRAALDASLSPATLRSYASSHRGFVAWCLLNSKPTTAETGLYEPMNVTLFLTHLASEKKVAPSTVDVARAAIFFYADKAGLDGPLRASAGLRRALAGVRREGRRSWTKTQAPAFTKAQVIALVGTCGSDLRGRRNRLYATLSLACGLRASDAVAIRIRHVEFTDGGNAILTIPYSKTSDVAVKVGIVGLPEKYAALDPVRALHSWFDGLRAMGEPMLPDSPLLRPIRRGGFSAGTQPLSAEALGGVLKSMVAEAGIESEKPFTSHSCRATFATLSLAAGVPESEVQRTGRWASADMLRTYNRASLFSQPASAYLGMDVE